MSAHDGRVLAFADLALDWSAHAVTRGRREVHLTPTEFRLLDAFLRAPGGVITLQHLMAQLWGAPDWEGPSSASPAPTFIASLRRKLERGGQPRLIHTVRGAGYVLREGP